KDATEAKLAAVKEVRNVINQKLDELLSSGQLTHSLTRNSEDPTQYSILIQKDLSSTSLENGFYKYPVVTITPTSNDGILAGDDYIYKQSFSTVYARNWLVGSNYDEKFKRGGSFRVSYIAGNPTIQIPSEGSATYTGKAFNADNRGNFEYNVNFATRQGSGRIYALDNNLPEIYLDKNTDENTMIQGRVLNQETVMKITSSASINNKQVGQYTLGFFGDNAQDIAGEVYIDQELPNAVRTNGNTQERYEGKVRGVVFAVAGTKE
ncbi:factor H binding protein domain-containing protein, partial [Gallibacterium genomosp. 3]